MRLDGKSVAGPKENSAVADSEKWSWDKLLWRSVEALFWIALALASMCSLQVF